MPKVGEMKANGLIAKLMSMKKHSGCEYTGKGKCDLQKYRAVSHVRPQLPQKVSRDYRHKLYGRNLSVKNMNCERKLSL